MLQQHSSLRTIKKKLIRKALDMIRKLAEEDPDESNDRDKKGVLYVMHICYVHCARPVLLPFPNGISFVFSCFLVYYFHV